MFAFFNPKCLTFIFCYVINVNLILGLLQKINVDLSLHIFISAKLSKI